MRRFSIWIALLTMIVAIVTAPPAEAQAFEGTLGDMPIAMNGEHDRLQYTIGDYYVDTSRDIAKTFLFTVPNRHIEGDIRMLSEVFDFGLLKPFAAPEVLSTIDSLDAALTEAINDLIEAVEDADLAIGQLEAELEDAIADRDEAVRRRVDVETAASLAVARIRAFLDSR